MNWLAATFLVVAFLVLLQVLRVPARVAEIGGVARAALRTLRARDLGDAEKERAMRAGSLRLFGLFGRIALAAAVAFALPAGIVAALAGLGVVDWHVTLELTLSWQILLGATVLGVVAMGWRGRARS